MHWGHHVAGNGTGDMFKRKRKKLKMEPLRRGKEEKRA